MSHPDHAQPTGSRPPRDASCAEVSRHPAPIHQPTSRIPDYLAALSQLQHSVTTPILSIIVFGSAAKPGFASETSDVDLIVVLPDSASRADKDHIRQTVAALELAHGLRSPHLRSRSRLEKLADRAAGHAMSSFICTRSDLLSGNVGRILELSPVEALFIDRIVLATILISAMTLCGEDLLPLVPIPPIRRLDLFKALFNFTSATAMSAALFPLLPDATRYAIDILKHSIHSCYFCYHLHAAPLAEEVAFFSRPAWHTSTIHELLERRKTYSPSFPFVLRCFPALLRLHLVTARENRFPQSPIRADSRA